MTDSVKGKIVFIGAGPGDAELLTLKGQKLINQADLILYAGSLLPASLFDGLQGEKEIVNTAKLNLKEQVSLMQKASSEGKLVVRLHTGDPSVYGALHEQTRELDALGITYEIVPGVSSVFAAAAALGIEFTIPELTQSLILTRMSGKTPVPEPEALRSMAAHYCSMAIYLSTNMIDKVVDELLSAGYAPETPIAVVYRASWPDQRILRSTLKNISAELVNNEITHQGLIIVSPALDKQAETKSHLYGSYQNIVLNRKGIKIFALTKPAMKLGTKIVNILPESELNIPPELMSEASLAVRVKPFQHGFREALQSAFKSAKALVCIMASGIVIREIAPLLIDKHHDPAVLISDVEGKFIVSLLSGHEGGANKLAQEIAKLTGGQVVITTASDQQNMVALDLIAQKEEWKIAEGSNLAGVMSALVNQESVALLYDSNLTLPQDLLALPWSSKQELQPGKVIEETKAVLITYRVLSPSFLAGFKEKVIYRPKVLTVGIGCNRNCPMSEIEEAIRTVFNKEKLALQSIASLASVTEKADEGGLLQLSKNWKLPIQFFKHAEIETLTNAFTHSPAAKKALGVNGVSEPCAMLAAGTNALLIPKRKFTNVTVAVALRSSAS